MNTLQNYDVECALLGMTFSNHQIAERVSAYPDDCFSFPETRQIKAAVSEIIKDGGFPDEVTVMTKTIQPDGSDLTSTIMSCIDKGFSTSMLGQYEAILMECRSKRIMYAAMNKAMRDLMSAGTASEQVRTFVESSMKIDNPIDPPKNMEHALMQFLNQIGKKEGKCNTGIAKFNEKTGGIHGGMLVILGARPGVGKSALAQFIAMNTAFYTGTVLYVSLEMDEAEIAGRAVAYAAKVETRKVLDGDLESSQKAGKIYSDLSKLRMTIDNHSSTPIQIRNAASNIKREKGLALIVIDYLQLMRPDKKNGSRYEDVSDISRELKLLAMDLKTPIIALTQFNRLSEAGNGLKKRPPNMSEARDSGSIEQDANMFLTLYPAEEPDQGADDRWKWDRCKDDDSQWMKLAVDKNRSGGVGVFNLKFNKKHMTFLTFDD